MAAFLRNYFNPNSQKLLLKCFNTHKLFIICLILNQILLQKLFKLWTLWQPGGLSKSFVALNLSSFFSPTPFTIFIFLNSVRLQKSDQSSHFPRLSFIDRGRWPFLTALARQNFNILTSTVLLVSGPSHVGKCYQFTIHSCYLRVFHFYKNNCCSSIIYLRVFHMPVHIYILPIFSTYTNVFLEAWIISYLCNFACLNKRYSQEYA